MELVMFEPQGPDLFKSIETTTETTSVLPAPRVKLISLSKHAHLKNTNREGCLRPIIIYVALMLL